MSQRFKGNVMKT